MYFFLQIFPLFKSFDIYPDRPVVPNGSRCYISILDGLVLTTCCPLLIIGVLLQTTSLPPSCPLLSVSSLFLCLACVLLPTRERGWKSACGLFYRQKMLPAHTEGHFEAHMRNTSMHRGGVQYLEAASSREGGTFQTTATAVGG